MNLDLHGKNALVCGASDGIGWASAVELAKLGANICLFARNIEKLEKRMKQLPKDSGQEHSYLVTDFSKLSNVSHVLENQNTQFHILINNTGGPSSGKILEESTEKFAETFEQHLLINQYLSQKLVPFMLEKGFGRIVNIISVSVKQPILGLGVSNTVRWAVASWSKTLSKELSHTGITVNNVLPGFTKTSRLDQLNAVRAEQEGKSVKEIEKNMEASIPSGRFASPEEVGAAVAFLCSPVAQSINGINLPVDGGLSATL